MTDLNTAGMVDELRSTNDTVRGMSWVSPGLGMPTSPMGLLGAVADPLSALAGAGLSWFMPFISFLGEPLTQLQGGNAASVSSGAQSFDGAGQDMAGLAGDYQAATNAETTSWTGSAATDYRASAEQHANGITGLGEGSNTTAGAIIGAGQVVAQAIAEITEIISEAVGEIVPIMTQAMARQGPPPADPGAVAEAIPPCVGIAVTAAAKCVAKLAALLASGQNLMKLVQGGMAIVGLINTALSSISQQSVQSGATPQQAGTGAGAGADQSPGDGLGSNIASADPGGNTDAASAGSPAPSASTPSAGGGSLPSDLSLPDGSANPDGSPVPRADPLGVAAQTAAVPPLSGTVPETSGYPAHTGGPSTGAMPGGALPVGAGSPGLAAGARSGAARGADTVRPERKQPQASAGEEHRSGSPVGGLGGVRGGEKDKEHKRKYPVVEQHDDDVLMVAPAVITSRTTKP